MTGFEINKGLAREHLTEAFPEGPYLICYRDALGKMVGSQFEKHRLEEALNYAGQLVAHRLDIYIYPATPIQNVHKQPGKDEIRHLDYSYCDFDCIQAGRTVEECEGWIMLNFPKYGLLPHFVIRSGYGLHLWFRIERQGKDGFGAVERINQALEIFVRAPKPGAWNLNHGSRLAGTYNFKYDTAVPVTLTRGQANTFNEKERYALSDFARLIEMAEEMSKKRHTTLAANPENPPPDLGDADIQEKLKKYWPIYPRGVDLLRELTAVKLSEVPSSVNVDDKKRIVLNEKAKKIARQEITPTTDRSALMMSFAKQAIKIEPDFAAILSVLLDHEYTVSAHVRDKTRAEGFRDARRAVAAAIGSSYKRTSDRHIISYTKSKSTEIYIPAVKEIDDYLVKIKYPIFQRGEMLVEPVLVGNRRILRPMSIARMCLVLSQIIEFFNDAPRTHNDCPARLAQLYLENYGNWNLPHCLGIVSAPTLRSDGSLLMKEGYDPESKMFVDYGGIDFGTIPENPTQEEAFAARDYVKETMLEFPLDGPRGGELDTVSRSALLSCWLSGMVVGSVPRMPMFVASAPRHGTGKSFAIDLDGLWAAGLDSLPKTPWSQSPEEQRKSLSSSIFAGSPFLFFDNIDDIQDLKSAHLERILTAGTWSDRLLGHSKNIEVVVRTQIIVSGNNLALAKGLQRRAILIYMDAEMEKPWEKRFQHDEAWFRARRVPMVKALLTILRYRIVSGEVERACVNNSFPEWNHMVRDAVINIGWKDPSLSVENITVAADDNGVDEDVGELLAALLVHLPSEDNPNRTKHFRQKDLMEFVGKAMDRNQPDSVRNQAVLITELLKEAASAENWSDISKKLVSNKFNKWGANVYRHGDDLLRLKLLKQNTKGSEWRVERKPRQSELWGAP